jgi:hypothetical protein
MNIDDLVKHTGVSEDVLKAQKVTLYDVLVMANNNDADAAGVTIVKFLSDLCTAAEEARIKVYWRTRWSHGSSSWRKETFHPNEDADDIRSLLIEEADREGGFSDHYRGFDFVIVKSWLEDPDVVFAVVKAMKQ